MPLPISLPGLRVMARIDGNCLMEGDHPQIGLYIHWPFCASKCPYCDFNSHVVRNLDQGHFLRLLMKEMDGFARDLGPRQLTSIFIGGGTPSLMEVSTLAGLLDHAALLWPFAPDIEISMEANPSSVEAARFEGYLAAGVNRLSIGVQALQNEDLRRLGRLHTVEEALEAIALARRFFPRRSFDLIYARPGQTPEDWRKELSRALDLEPTHLSLYQLTFEEGTPFDALRRAGKMTPLDDDLSADLYELTQEICVSAGLPAYEISNHAAPGEECRHNLIYWQGQDYIGVGPGAHGRLTIDGERHGTICLSDPKAWSKAVEERGEGLLQRSVITPEEQGVELMLMGLRVNDGVSLERYRALAGRDLDPVALSDLQEQGLITIKKDRLKVLNPGRPLLNRILQELLV